MSSSVEQTKAAHESVTDAVVRAIAKGAVGMCYDFFTEKEMANMNIEAEKVRPLSRNIREWHQTDRTTLVPFRAVRRAFHLPFIAELWAPETTKAANRLANAVRATGQETRVTELSAWRPTRLGINYMRGSTANPAHIPPHVDVEKESGLVAVVQLGEGQAGDVELILGADVCQSFNLEQHRHEVRSCSERASLTIANLVG